MSVASERTSFGHKLKKRRRECVPPKSSQITEAVVHVQPALPVRRQCYGVLITGCTTASGGPTHNTTTEELFSFLHARSNVDGMQHLNLSSQTEVDHLCRRPALLTTSYQEIVPQGCDKPVEHEYELFSNDVFGKLTKLRNIDQI